MAYQNPFARQLDPQIDVPPVHVQTMEDVERRRKALSMMGLDDSWLGKANKMQGELIGARDAVKEGIQSRLLGGAASTPMTAAGGGGAGGGLANAAAKTAAQSGAMSAAGAAL